MSNTFAAFENLDDHVVDINRVSIVLKRNRKLRPQRV